MSTSTIFNTSKMIDYGRDLFGFAYDKASENMTRNISYTPINILIDAKEKIQCKYDWLEKYIIKNNIKSCKQKRNLTNMKNDIDNIEYKINSHYNTLSKEITKNLMLTNATQNKFLPNYIYYQWNYSRCNKACNISFNFE